MNTEGMLCNAATGVYVDGLFMKDHFLPPPLAASEGKITNASSITTIHSASCI